MQLGNKGFGEPLKFDNVYYKELLKKPWADPSNDMASMIGLPSDKVGMRVHAFHLSTAWQMQIVKSFVFILHMLLYCTTRSERDHN